MTRHNRMLSIISIAGLLAGIFQAIANPAFLVRAQETEGEVPLAQTFPLEIALDNQFFLYDQAVSRSSDGLIEVGRQGDSVILAESEVSPRDQIFVSAQTPEGDRLARYLSEISVGPDGQASPANPCRAEPVEFGELDTGTGVYAFAGTDDVPVNSLDVIATTADGPSIYGNAQQQPPDALYLDAETGLKRFVLLDAQGRPPVLGDVLQFQGGSFAFEGEVSSSVDAARLAPIGCAGPFRVSALGEQAASGAVDQLFATVGARLFAYRAEVESVIGAEEGAIEPDASPGAGAESFGTPPSSAEQVPSADAVDEDSAVITTEGDEADPLSGTPDPGAVITEEPLAEADAGDAPLEVEVDGSRFALDRPVAVDLAGLKPVLGADGSELYAVGEAPYQRIYGATATETGQAGRYLPEAPVGPNGEASPEGTCLAETVNFDLVDVGGALYVYAGPEPDLTPDSLLEVLQTSDGQPVYAEDAAEPFGELFFPTGVGLDRFILLGENGLPITLGESIVFAGQSFTFSEDATGVVDPNALIRVGCIGPFSARADQPSDLNAFNRLFVVLNGQTPRVLAFNAEGAVQGAATAPASQPITPPAPPATPTPEPPAPTETAIPPTASPVPPTPTVVPTATEVPLIATELPATAPPLPPLATPTPVFVDETALPATPELPTATETPPIAAAEGTPAVEPETPIAATSTVPPATDQVAVPEVFPTVPPPAAPFSGVPIDAPAPVPPDWPREIQVQGIRYTFDLEVDIDPGTLEQIDVVQAPDATLDIFASAEDQAGSVRLNAVQTALVGPFGRVYAVSVETGVVARYISEVTITTAGQFDIVAPCAAEANPRTFSHTFDDQQYAYTFASREVNVSVEELRAATVTAFGDVPLTDDGREILVRGGGYPGLAEVFLPDGDALERYVALNAAGFPVTLSNLVFAETRFQFASQISVNVTDAGLRRIGCSGPFPLFAPIEQAEALSPVVTTFTVIDARVYQFTAIEIVIAPAGQTPPPPSIVPPPPGFVQITLQTTVNVWPLPTPLPNIRVVPLPVQPGTVPAPTPAAGLVVQAPERQRRCQGDPGAIGANGLPERLPASIQLSGISYRFVNQEQLDNDITLTRLSCVGPFEAVQATGSGAAQVIYLRIDRRADVLYRYEAQSSFAVDFSVSGDARVITTGDQRYLLNETWQRSLYGSVTVILYMNEPESADPTRVFAVQVDGDVIAEYVPEGGDVVEAPAELRARAEEMGINPDLVLGGGRRYLLVNLWSASGTTTNGWVTLYSSTGEGGANSLLATDPRSLDLFVYRRSGAAGG